ncbi:hypothetical protein D9M68_781920 [compost metagenome]
MQDFQASCRQHAALCLNNSIFSIWPEVDEIQGNSVLRRLQRLAHRDCQAFSRISLVDYRTGHVHGRFLHCLRPRPASRRPRLCTLLAQRHDRLEMVRWFGAPGQHVDLDERWADPANLCTEKPVRPHPDPKQHVQVLDRTSATARLPAGHR